MPCCQRQIRTAASLESQGDAQSRLAWSAGESEWIWSNAIVVRAEDGLILVDPGIDGSDLNQLADDLDGLGIPVVAGFSTHPHWDHLLWHSRFGDEPRYATSAGAHAAGEARERGRGWRRGARRASLWS
jgi:glyoxylase-like metal-dependent hydrolase (beta-lactamase superfamily II)